MKITCQSCAAKYTIADEKVAGKTVKIKCKKCGATIVVNGAEVGYAAAAPDPYAQQGAPQGNDQDEEGDGQTSVFTGDQSGTGAPGGGGDWTVNVADDDQRTMSSDAIAAAYASGVVTNDTYVWRDGMADWSPLSGVPELASLVSRSAPAAAQPYAAPAAAAPAGVGLSGTVMMNDSAPAPAAAAAPTAARRAAARPEKADPFAASQQAAAAAAPPPAPKLDRQVGERNENSMLFSISALTAAKEARDKDKGGPAQKNGGRGGVDDILNLGGGSAPILAPPPLLAPIVEPPPMAAPVMQQPMSPGMGAMPGQPMGMGAAQPMGMDDMYPRKKSPIGLILGIVGGLVVVGGVAAFFLTRPDPTAGTTPDTSSASAMVSAAPAPSAVASTPTPTAVDTSTTAAAPTDTTAPATTAGGTAPAGTQKAGGTGPVGPTGPGPAVSAKPSAAPTAEPPKPAETATAAPPPTDGAEFNRGAATSALGAAAGAAKSCKKPDGPTGSGRVKVTFAPSGNVTSATVEGPPFAGTPVGGCIASAFRSAHVPPFSGPPVSVSKSFNIN